MPKFIELQEHQYDLARDLVATGWRLRDVARALGVGYRTLLRMQKRDERLADAIEEGRGTEYQALVASLYRRAMDPKDKAGAPSAMFLLKAKHGLREHGPIEGSDGSRVNVVIALPGALDPSQYAQIASHHPGALEGSETPPELPAPTVERS